MAGGAASLMLMLPRRFGALYVRSHVIITLYFFMHRNSLPPIPSFSSPPTLWSFWTFSLGRNRVMIPRKGALHEEARQRLEGLILQESLYHNTLVYEVNSP